jgi:hypothetical protein
MITVQELESRAKAIAELRSTIDMKNAELKEMNAAITELETSFIAALEEAGKTSYDSEFGRLTCVSRETYKTPKTLEEKEALFNWLKEKGIFMETVSVVSQTLNALAKREKEASEERGEVFFQIPGLTEKTVSQYLSFRKK